MSPLRVSVVLLLLLPAVKGTHWWDRQWTNTWVNVSVLGQTHPILARRVGEGPRKIFCIQGGPGSSFWDLNFLAVYLDLERFEIIQYDPLGSAPSACSQPGEPCSQNRAWMTIPSFVSMMDQVYNAMQLPTDTIIMGHSFGVIVTLEFMLKWPHRAVGLVLSDMVPSQEQYRKRYAWCNATGWRDCRIFNQSKQEPWFQAGLTNHSQTASHAVWGSDGAGTGGALQGWDVRDRLHLLRHVPTLSYAGEYDLVFASDVMEMSELLQGDFRVVDGAGHHSFVDNRDVWLRAFQSWQLRIAAPRPKPASSACYADPPVFLSGPEPVPQWMGDRRYYLSIPAGYSPVRSYAVVLSFHGLAAPVQEAPFYGPVPEAWGDTIVAFPVGKQDIVLGGRFASTWNGSGSVGSPGPAGPTCNTTLRAGHAACADSCHAQGGCRDACWLTTCVDDVSFITALLNELESRFCVDITSVHAVGFSGGGWFALELGTNAQVAHRFKSIIAFAGLPFRGFNKPPAIMKGSRFVGVYGRADLTVPGFPNSPADPTEAIASSGFAFSSWKNTSRLWASTLGCGDLLSSSSALRPDTGVLDCFDYNCSEGSVSVCLWDGPHALVPGALSIATQTFFPTRFSKTNWFETQVTDVKRTGALAAFGLAAGLLALAAVVAIGPKCSSKRELAAPLLTQP